ncbi:aldehyde dehydrogenase family 3 member B2 isoform X4 [Vicugna pacos]|uniref:Aldehyde dehydrogenase n=1 Tax=Vicugna pacos TaxID=30538 RepID=A0ABM5E059_VICPA
MGVNVGVRRRPDQMELQLVRPRCRSTARCVHRRRPAAAQAPGRIGGRQGWGETWAWSSRHIWRQNVRQRQQRFGKGSRIGADTGSAFEGDVSEIIICQNEVDLALKNLHAWMKDESVAKNLFTQLDSAFIRKEPFGLVLIVAPWNYPVNLTLVPLVGALAAGNCVVLKPSEISKGTEKVLAEVLPRYLDQSCFAVVLGGPEETGQLLKHKFDYILFTGSPRVGKIIMAAATKHLTPVTLELGGKNPCYVDDDCDPQTVANRVAWFRYFNTGQTCVAPDYVLCSPEMQARLLPALQSAITRFYGEDPQSSPDLGRIINHKHFQRLRDLLSCGRVAIGGQSDESECYIGSPHGAGGRAGDRAGDAGGDLWAHPAHHEREGPGRGHRLHQPSGEAPGPVRLLQQQPGNSGMGRYHGKFSFDTFSHHRACLLSCSGLEKLNAIRYPPYSEWKQQLISWALGKQSCTLL